MSEEINNTAGEVAEPSEIEGFKKFEITVRDTSFVIAMLVSSILISAFGVFGGFRGGFTVTAIILNIIMSAYLIGNGFKYKLFPALCLLLSVGVSLNFSVSSNGAVRFWSFIIFGLLNIVWFTSAVRIETAKGDLGLLRFIISPLFEGLGNIPVMFVSLFSGKQDRNKKIGKILAGILLALPVMIVVMPLLMNSDEAFSGMISVIFEETSTIIFRSLFGVFISIFIISYALSLKKYQPISKNAIGFSGAEPIIIISFLSVLSVCYLSYLFSQLAYFFDAFKGFLPEGYKFTYSAYARRGFFEMTIISAINCFVILLCRLLANKQNKRPIIAINILSTFIGAFTLIIIATALSKMFLYIDIFGMTKLRITTSAFMFFLAVVFIALMLRLYTGKINVVKTAFVTAAVIIILLGTVNVNSVVAGYNYNAYKTGDLKKIDVKTISELGDEGIPYLVLLTKDKNSQVSDVARSKLSEAYDDYYTFEYDEYGGVKSKERVYDELGQLSIARQRAYNELEAYLKKDPFILENKYNNDFEDGIW